MTQDEIIRMAREAGFQVSDTFGVQAGAYPIGEKLARFAALVAAHAKQEYIDSVYEQHRETMFSNKDLGMLVDAVKAEREACAKVCDEWNWSSKHGSNPSGQLAVLAAAIRARGQA